MVRPGAAPDACKCQNGAGPLSIMEGMERMNLLRSICSLFGSRCAGEEPKATNERPVAADLGQKEAEQETTGKEQMSHMEGGNTTKTRR